MNIVETKLHGVIILETVVFKDDRGYFKETFQEQRYRELGINPHFVQDNLSRSTKGVLRGLHYQSVLPQGKLVSCSRGVVFDVVADINPSSITYGQYLGIELSEDNHRQVWIPPGYAHGFCVLSDVADFQYKCTSYYDARDESGVNWKDPELGIDWPEERFLVSRKDQDLPFLSEINR